MSSAALHLTAAAQNVPSVYVAATRQHVGKTSVSLAVMSGLKKRLTRVGFLKPVGQKSVHIDDGAFQGPVDKDAACLKQHFGLSSVPWEDVSPVLIPAGYTKRYLDGHLPSVRPTITAAFNRLAEQHDGILCEGTGHVAVGSVIDASNATVASWLSTPVVLVVNASLGDAVDQLDLNRHYLKRRGVPLAGIVVNRVDRERYDATEEYLTKAVNRWQDDTPMLGFVPERPYLGCPTLTDLERLLDGQLVSGQDLHALRHYRVTEDVHVVACALEVFLQRLRQERRQQKGDGEKRTLYVCHASRQDILLGFLLEAVQQPHLTELPPAVETTNTGNNVSSLVVTGCADYPLSTQILEIIDALPRAPPILLTPHATDATLEFIYGHTAKLNSNDPHRVATTVEHYEPYIDFSLLLERMERATPPSGIASRVV